MATLQVPETQVIDLITQLSPEGRAEALARLLENAQWDELLRYGEQKLDAQLARRGLSRSTLSGEQIEAEIERIADGRE